MPQDTDLQAKDALTPVETKRTGRPSIYNEPTALLICERIAEGETLTAICQTPGMPHRMTVHRWRRKYPDFDIAYIQARVDQAEGWADEILTIADDSTLDKVTKTDPKGREFEAVDHENIQRSRLMVDTRKFLMSKVSPRYADKIEHAHTGGITHTVKLEDRERMRRLATFMLEDKAAGLTIEGEASQALDHSPLPNQPDTESATISARRDVPEPGE